MKYTQRLSICAIIMSAAALSSSVALAQLLQPRCGGWPASIHGSEEGLLVGTGGEICYAYLATRARATEAIVNVSIVRGPSRGTLTMVGADSFSYRPAKTMHGYDEFTIGVVIERSGQQEQKIIRYKATTAEEYQALGGTASTPPAGVSVQRYGGGHRGREPLGLR